MIRTRLLIARACLRLYPHTWRSRYADEVVWLLEERGARGVDLVDLAMAGLRLRASTLKHTDRGSLMLSDRAHRHPTAFAIVALILVLPTAAFVALSLLGHELGLPGLATSVDPVISAVTSWRPIDLALVTAPALSALIAVAPLLEIGRREAPGDGVLTLALHLRAANLAVAGLAIAVGIVLVGHAFAEAALHA